MNFDDLLAELDDIPGVPGASSKKNTSASSHRDRLANTGASISGSKPLSVTSSSSQNLPTSPRASSQSMPSQSMQTRGGSIKNEAVTSVSSHHQYKNSIDTLLDDLDIPSSSPIPAKQSPLHHAHTAPSQRPSATATSAKCLSLFIGGAGGARGRNGSQVGRVLCCDTLRCTKCDFKVIWFESRAWKGDVDYLFFRNNYPTESKLLPSLTSDHGSRSYCCQCSWRTARDQSVVDSFSGDLRWVCGGHSSS